MFTQIVALPGGGGAACPGLTLPAGVNFVLTRALVTSTVPLLEVVFQPIFKTAASNLQADILIPIDAIPSNFGFDHRGAMRDFDMVVKPGSTTTGDIYFLGFCVASNTAGTATITITGQKINGPTAPVVDKFTARPHAHGAQLGWTTGTETNLLGFNVWRYRNGKGVEVNGTLIRAKRSGEPNGASYSFLDKHPGARRGLTYRLQLVNLNGERSWYAAFAIPA